MSEFKYGLLIIEDTPNDEKPFQLAADAWTFERKFETLFGERSVDHWQSWIGVVDWNRLSSARRVVAMRHPSTRLNVIDHENQSIRNRLEQIRLALLLTGPNGLAWGGTWFFDGQAADGSWGSPLTGIQTSARGERIVRPFYCTRETYSRLRPWPRETGWLERWRLILERLTHAGGGGYPPLLFFALIAFERAFVPFAIEFKIPDCVRAAEAILGLPRNRGGANEFARRVRTLLPELEHDPYVGGPEIASRLVELYGHRNDCVHGKIPFARLKERGEEGEEEAAKFDYLAESVARGALNRALAHPNMRKLFSDRTVLEEAWASGSFAQVSAFDSQETRASTMPPIRDGSVG